MRANGFAIEVTDASCELRSTNAPKVARHLFTRAVKTKRYFTDGGQEFLADELGAWAYDGCYDQVAQSNQRDYQDRPAWFEIMRGIEALGEPLLPVERLDELTPDYRLELTLGQGRRALVHLSALIKRLEARSDDEAA